MEVKSEHKQNLNYYLYNILFLCSVQCKHFLNIIIETEKETETYGQHSQTGGGSSNLYCWTDALNIWIFGRKEAGCAYLVKT